jgi:hypothetical protein
MFERYVRTTEDRDLALQGARDSMAIDRAYRGALGYYMEKINQTSTSAGAALTR